MSILECIVMDFEGVFTQVEEEAAPYIAAFRRALAARTGLLPGEVSVRFDRIRAQIEDEPEQYGWEFDGLIVAPVQADPFLHCRFIGARMLSDLGKGGPEREKIVSDLHQECLPLAPTVFRPEAKTVLETILASGVPTFIVTSGPAAAIRTKIDELDPVGKGSLNVYGDARKHVIHPPSSPHPLFDSLAEQIEVPKLERPIYLRRGFYFDVLRRIWDEVGTGPEGTFVCGTCYELDLALPARLGAQTHLIESPSTMEYERRAVRGRPGGTSSNDLSGILIQLEIAG